MDTLQFQHQVVEDYTSAIIFFSVAFLIVFWSAYSLRDKKPTRTHDNYTDFDDEKDHL